MVLAFLQESETIEMKKSLSELKEGLVSIAAILNKQGAGELWFGVAPNGQATGLTVSDKTLRDLSQSIGAHIEPRIYPQIDTQIVAGKTCIRIRFEGQDPPYFAHGRAYVRVADEDRQLSVKALEKYILGKHRDALRWDNQTGQLTLSELSSAKVKAFAQRARVSWSALGASTSARVQQALTKLELLQSDGRLCNTARLFFTHEPVELRCAVFGTTDTATIIDRHDFKGDILTLIEEAQKYILKNIHIGMRIEGLLRVDVPEISTEALREAVINAFCHRDWRDPDYVQVAIFKNRVEIRNPGTLYGNLTIEDLHRGNVSQRRNPLIAELFRRIEMVEAWGRGMTLIHENAPDVAFREIGNLFIASFARPSFEAVIDQETVDKTVDKTVDMVATNKFTQREAWLLQMVVANPRLSQKQLADLLGLSERGVRYLTDKLQKQGVLQRQGGKKMGQWIVAIHLLKNP